MADYRFVVLSNAVEGQDDAYNDWYESRHIDDVLAIPGFTRAQRCVWDNDMLAGGQPPAHKYLAIYDFETDDLTATLGQFFARSGTDAMPMSDAMAQDAAPTVYRVLGPARTRAGG